MSRADLRREDGAALVVALLVMMVFMVMGLAALRVVDSQQRDSGRERTRESSFALTEGALSAQIFALSRSTGWPTQSPGYQPCTQASTSVQCPTAAEITRSFSGVDFTAGRNWSTEIHDNRVGTTGCTTPPQPGSNFYDDRLTGTRGQPGYDANCDGFLWVRAQGTLYGRVRTLVALVRAEQLAAEMPRYGVVAGSLDITTNGNHTYIDGGPPNSVYVRCKLSDKDCARYDPGSLKPAKPSQINGTVVSDPTFQSGLSPETIERLRDTARANGTYYDGCAPTLTGAVVFIEKAYGCPAYNPPGNTAYNSATSPGVVVVGEGLIELGGNATFYGLIYNVNRSDELPPDQTPDTTVVRTSGSARIIGGVLIDGRGRLEVGSNNGGPGTSGNVVFDPRAFDSVRVYGTAGIVQNSFREIAPAS